MLSFSYKMIIRIVLPGLAILAAMALTACDDKPGQTVWHISNKTADVAVYDDRGCWEPSTTASENMFRWMGYSVTRISARYINNADLSGFRLICVPGGNMTNYAEDISPAGKEKMRQFVADGGGYIGLCAGSHFAAERVLWSDDTLPYEWLGLFPGSTTGTIVEIYPYPNYGMCRVNIANDDHYITQPTAGDAMWILYYWGPALLPDPGTDVEVLGRYAVVDLPCMIACEYGQGRVFITGAHPEIEENSDRDSTDACSELDDRESDWDCMKRAAAWCLHEDG